MTTRKPGRPPVNPALIAAARELLAEGAPLTATAETLGIAPNTLRNYGLVGISHREAGSLGRAVRMANAIEEAGGSLARARRRAGAAGL